MYLLRPPCYIIGIAVNCLSGKVCIISLCNPLVIATMLYKYRAFPCNRLETSLWRAELGTAREKKKRSGRLCRLSSSLRIYDSNTVSACTVSRIPQVWRRSGAKSSCLFIFPLCQWLGSLIGTWISQFNGSSGYVDSYVYIGYVHVVIRDRKTLEAAKEFDLQQPYILVCC